MKIKNKLLGLIGIPSIGILLASVITLLTYLPYERMQSEQKELFSVETTLIDFQKEIVGFTFKSVQESEETFQVIKTAVDQSFIRVSELETLYNASERISLSIDTIESLQDSFEAEWADFLEKFQAVKEDLYLIEGVEPDASILELYQEGYENSGDRNWRILIADMNTLKFQVESMDRSLTALVGVINSEFATIDEQLDVVRLRILGLVVGVFLFVLIVSIIVAVLQARGINANIQHIYSRIEELGRGDLTIAVEVKSKDELQELGDNVNQFIGGLNQAICDIKVVSQETVEVKNNLITSIGEAETASSNIKSSAASIVEEVRQLEGRIDTSDAAVKTVSEQSGEILEMLQEHTAMVEESTAAITEMISSIANVAENSERRYAATETLMKTIERGSKQLSDTAGIINAITENIDNIRDTVKLIQNVASQTSLLSMNAAIEAAHAGDKGAGFAVVADEIRKLSDETSAGSKHISDFLKTMISRIEQAAHAGNETQSVFQEVDQVVSDVGNSLSEISASMRELNIGGKQILEATSSLQEFSLTLKDKGQEMGRASSQLSETMSYTRTTSSGVQDLISKIGVEIVSINDSMQAVGKLSGNLDEMTTNVDKSLEQFSTEVVQTSACEDVVG